jgi:antitoxin VapB
MSLNIKNPRTTALVRKLAERTGTSQTQAVEAAVIERLAALDADHANDSGTKETKLRTASALLNRIRDDLSEDTRNELRSAESELYDEAGLPR